MSLVAATRYVFAIKTNVALILASACGYYFLAGVQTFGVEFVTEQYGIAQALSSLVLVLVGVAGVVGVLAGGTLGDFLLHRGYLNGRILVSAIAAAPAVVFFIPAIFTHSPLTALPYISLAVLALAAQNPPLDAAPARHHATAPVGASGGRAHLPADDGPGVRTAPLRGRLRLHLRRRAFRSPVDLYDHAPPAGGKRLLPLQGASHVSTRRRNGKRDARTARRHSRPRMT
jgi:hypothetical protein